MKERVSRPPPHREFPCAERGQAGGRRTWLRRGTLERGSSGRDGSARYSSRHCLMPVKAPPVLGRSEEKWYHGHCVRLLSRQRTGVFCRSGGAGDHICMFCVKELFSMKEKKSTHLKLDTRKTVLDLFFGNGVALAMPFPRFVSRSTRTRGVFPQGHRICQSAVPCVRLKFPAYGRKLLSPCHSVRRVSVRPCRDTHAPC